MLTTGPSPEGRRGRPRRAGRSWAWEAKAHVEVFLLPIPPGSGRQSKAATPAQLRRGGVKSRRGDGAGRGGQGGSRSGRARSGARRRRGDTVGRGRARIWAPWRRTAAQDDGIRSPELVAGDGAKAGTCGADPPSPPSSRTRGEQSGACFCNFLSVARFSVISIML